MLNGSYPNKNGVASGVDKHHGGKGDFSLAKGNVEDTKLIRRAIDRRWPVKRGTRRRICYHLDEAFPNADPDLQTKIAAVFVRMDEANLRRDEFEDKVNRLEADQPTENVGVRYRVTFDDSPDRHRSTDALPEATGGDLDR